MLEEFAPLFMPFTGFADIARRHYRQVEALEEGVPAQPSVESTDEWEVWNAETQKDQRRIAEGCTITVLTTCAATELYINNAGVRLVDRVFYDGFFNDELERVPTVKKWLLVPRIASGYQMNKGAAPYQDLTSTFSVRDMLMHPKTVPFDDNFWNKASSHKDQPGSPKYLRRAACRAIRALDGLYAESVYWHDQAHALQHLLGDEHPRFAIERAQHWKSVAEQGAPPQSSSESGEPG